MVEDRAGAASAGHAQFPLADGRFENRPAEGDPKRQIQRPVLRGKSCTIRELFVGLTVAKRSGAVKIRGFLCRHWCNPLMEILADSPAQEPV